MRRARVGSHRFAFTALAAARRWRRAHGRIARSRAGWMPLALRWRRPGRATPATLARDRRRAAEPAVAHREPGPLPGGGIERVVRERLTFATFARETRAQSRDRLVVATTSRERLELAHLAVHHDRPGAPVWRLRPATPDRRVEARRDAAARDVTRDARGYAFAAFPASVFGVTRDFAPMRRPHAMRGAQASNGESDARTSPRTAQREAAARTPADSIAALQRTAPLVWRQRDDRRDTMRTMAAARTPVAPESMAPRAPSAIRDAIPQPAPAAPPSQPHAVPRLDAQFVDRLADDVIRRVEKRARIERERRGL